MFPSDINTPTPIDQISKIKRINNNREKISIASIIRIIAFLTVLALSLILTRVATVALTMMGLSYEVAKFQARSPFTGTGFMTKEVEKVVSHPVRRRIIAMLMIIRNAGLVTIILSLILSLTGFTKGTQVLVRMG